MASLRISTLLSALLLFAMACSPGDVGAPCNHASVEPPESQVVTFPALTCNDLLCIYGDATEIPGQRCNTADDCNGAAPVKRFNCNSRNECELNLEYVLERSMCSRKCDTDDDCRDGGAGRKVVAEGSNCDGEFVCRRLQSLGEFCCTKMCVCDKDINETALAELAMDCVQENDKTDGCCWKLDPESGQPVSLEQDGCGNN